MENFMSIGKAAEGLCLARKRFLAAREKSEERRRPALAFICGVLYRCPEKTTKIDKTLKEKRRIPCNNTKRICPERIAGGKI